MEVWIVWSWEDIEQLATPVAAFSSRSRAESFVAQQGSGHFRCRRLALNPTISVAMPEYGAGSSAFSYQA